MATLVSAELHGIDEELRRIRKEVGEPMTRTVLAFLGQPISPETTFEFEKEMERLLREEGRRIMEMLLNLLEPDVPASLCLGHLSEDTNTPELALATRRKILGDRLPLYFATRYKVGDVLQI